MRIYWVVLTWQAGTTVVKLIANSTSDDVYKIVC